LNYYICAQNENIWLHRPALNVSGFLEVFYVYDFNQPKGTKRQSFLFNHNRHNEINPRIVIRKQNCIFSSIFIIINIPDHGVISLSVNSVLAPCKVGQNLKNKLGLTKITGYDKNQKKIHSRRSPGDTLGRRPQRAHRNNSQV
jgi:hypothetical protein